ncbi:MAG TPA: alginate export family protein [Paludibaculum sp.]|jgi:hypothetical protein
MGFALKLLAAASLAVVTGTGAWAQTANFDPGKTLADTLSAETGGQLKISFETRARYEDRTGNSFGKEPDRSYGLFRNRFGMAYTPVKWIRFSGMVQDSRVPGYGPGAPNNIRDRADLHEAYFELFPGQKTGFGFTAGRAMLNYGEGRLIGTPQWSNVARTYDNARLTYRTNRAQVEVLLISPVKIRTEEFNQPVFGDRIWGVYSTLPNAIGKSLVEVYVLRHDQNRIGGFTGGSRSAGTDRLATNTVGFRMAGPLAAGWKYSVENAWQGGEIGAASQRAEALFGGMNRRWMVGKRPLDLSAEYKYASGTDDPGNVKRSGTFDQLSPANHDKFGHEDIFGWRNLHNVRSLAILGLTKRLAANLMYDSIWLASRRDALYNGSGRAIVRSADGSAGRHVGQELDGYVTCNAGPYLFGGGYGYFFNGEVIRKLTPGAAPTYIYVFSSYSF